jgi:Tfp pilus assembly protein PilF
MLFSRTHSRLSGVFLLAFLHLVLSASGVAAAPAGGGAPSSPKVVVLGLDAADWAILDPLMAKGAMPELARLAKEGRTYVFESELPYLSPVLWTTIATGVPPADHGILDFEEFEPSDGSRVPVSSRSRDFPTLWSTASAKGKDVGFVGWWASWPCERLRGFCISDRIAPAQFDAPPVGGGLVFPEIQQKGVEKIRTEELARAKGDLRRVFGVDEKAAAALGAVGPKTIDGLVRLLSQSRIFLRSALSLGERVHPALLGIYIEGTDSVGHVAAKWQPPRLTGVPEGEYRVFSGAVEGFYREADRMVGEVAAFARKEGATLVVLSDHGFLWGDSRPALSQSDAWNTAAYWHRKEGMLLFSGPRVAPSPKRGRASIYDLAPTVSALLGLPIDSRMKGRVLSDSFRPPLPSPRKEDLRASVPVSLLPVAATSDATRRDADARRQELRALGYLTGGEKAQGAPSPGGRPGRTEGGWNNLGLLLRDKGESAAAERAFRKALEVHPGYASPWNNLSFLYLGRKRWADADDALLRAIETGSPRGEALLTSRIADYTKKGSPKGQLARFFAVAAKRTPLARRVAIGEGRARFEAKDCPGSSTIFEAWLTGVGDDTEALNLAATVRICLGDRDGAVERFRRSLRMDPSQKLPREVLEKLGANP